MSLIAKMKQTLSNVGTTDEFEHWVRNDLRRILPHAALLGTIGRLYGVGSVPTHRVSVDFPLGMIESLKNNVGALDDPLMHGWFRNERLRFRSIEELEALGEHRDWRAILLRYGIRSIMIHGVLDHTARRFAVFQICNVYGDNSSENIALFSLLVGDMAKSVWRAIDNRVCLRSSRQIIGHPTLSLTATELHIIEMLAQGLSNKEIARRRGVSDSTVKTQVQRTGAKVGATRRAEIVAIALPMLSPLPPQSMIDYDEGHSS